MDIGTLRELLKEQKDCFRKPDKLSPICAVKVFEKYARKNKIFNNLIYPWKNFNWNYVNFVKQNYDPKKLGVSSEGSASALVNDIKALIKIIEGFITDGNPNKDSSAGDPNKNNDLYPCSVSPEQLKNIEGIKQQINILENIITQSNNPTINKIYKQMINQLLLQVQATLQTCVVLNKLKIEDLKQKPPYKHDFFNKKLDGNQSSSYFAQIGICPTKIKSQNECVSKGYLWMGNPLAKKPAKDRGPETTSGSCFRGRYSYIDNKPGLAIGNIKSMKGLIPSLINNLNEISPNQLLYAAMGFGIPGMELQKCEENFQDSHYNIEKNVNNIILDFELFTKVVLIVLCIYIIIKIYNSR